LLPGLICLIQSALRTPPQGDGGLLESYPKPGPQADPAHIALAK
jgi:hypothetical protein